MGLEQKCTGLQCGRREEAEAGTPLWSYLLSPGLAWLRLTSYPEEQRGQSAGPGNEDWASQAEGGSMEASRKQQQHPRTGPPSPPHTHLLAVCGVGWSGSGTEMGRHLALARVGMSSLPGGEPAFPSEADDRQADDNDQHFNRNSGCQGELCREGPLGDSASLWPHALPRLMPTFSNGGQRAQKQRLWTENMCPSTGAFLASSAIQGGIPVAVGSAFSCRGASLYPDTVPPYLFSSSMVSEGPDPSSSA
ncbi:uncharacterized protein [Eulemur rufifrons]|uniref:uncharacterized protein n=1 Tax=Eulemur rufifrons TaxID=859984 RepID=UPI00374458B3